ncbi:hypothetical protein CIPAW_11G162700 [Carya illinoinensis]|uniref:Uncharacterized protein n=1 Tax=Carya illinoinensis TaxID=32201 RepID=A0A8T1NYC6_CARIL|nr:hypothetical protein CIPAW_11G162700 [Carya illinoinensis]
MMVTATHLQLALKEPGSSQNRICATGTHLSVHNIPLTSGVRQPMQESTMKRSPKQGKTSFSRHLHLAQYNFHNNQHKKKITKLTTAIQNELSDPTRQLRHNSNTHSNKP